MILQNKQRGLDFSNPLMSMDFKDTTIVEFFELYRRETGVKQQQQQAVEALTFVLTFANQTSLVLKRDDDEEVWPCMKERFKRLFWRVRSLDPDEKNFEIWVEWGDIGPTSQGTLEGDGW